jgi:hypothetical protein
MSKRNIQDIKIPNFDWDKVEALDKKTAQDNAEKSVEFLIKFRTYTSESHILLKRSIEEEAQKVKDNLTAWIKEYKGFIYVVQTAFLEKAREIAIKSGDSKTLFSRLKVLALEALFHRSVQDWEGRVDTAPYRLKSAFLSEVRMSKRTLFLLPNGWGNDTHKSTALVLKDLADKAKTKWMEEQGYIKFEPETSPETPPEEKKDEIELEPEKEKPRTTNSLKNLESIVH